MVVYDYGVGLVMLCLWVVVLWWWATVNSVGNLHDAMVCVITYSIILWLLFSGL